ncbi:pilus assembly FimT family protein [Lactobacillus sp.]|uniref:pilus assembly FimT family protein n=1 Tax=Lactobacillus sp. TaxID=1591 RepID=UPI003EFDF9E8
MRQKAFSLLETVITLAIAGMLLGIGEMSFQGFEDKINFDRFCRQAAGLFQEKIRSAAITGKRVVIYNQSEQGKLEVIQDGKHESLKIPDGITVYTSFSDKTGLSITNDGITSQPFTLRIVKNDKGKEEYVKKYTFLLPWGKINEK